MGRRAKASTDETAPAAPASGFDVSTESEKPEAPDEGSGLFLTPNQLSRRWSWSVRERTLRNWRGNGRGPKWVNVAGGRILYRVRDVEEYERAREGRFLPGT